MPVKRRTPKRRTAELTPFQYCWLLDRPLPEPTDVDKWWHIADAHDDEADNPRADRTGAALWREHRDELLAEFIATRPGRRPQIWWRVDAPRQQLGNWPGWYIDGKLEQPRERLGGVGTVSWDVFNVGPAYRRGIPAYWVTPNEVEIYSGRARDIHGQIMNPEWAKRPFGGVAIDPRDPPRFEAQACYLKRLGLFEAGEERRLRPVDFEVELVLPDPNDAPDPNEPDTMPWAA